MMKPIACVLAVAASATLLAATDASARGYRHHHRHYVRHHVHYRSLGQAPGSHVIPNVLVANPYGDVIIDGKTGFHRSDLGVMVPDSAPPSFVATGRATGSGLGANGLPGQNWQ